MPSIYTDQDLHARHTDEMQDIITKVPSWLLRWGITLFFVILLLIVGLAALIRYPDLVKAQLKIDSPNSSKPVVAKINGKLVKLLATENIPVKAGEPLGYIESTANHEQVLSLLSNLHLIQQRALQYGLPVNLSIPNDSNNQLGELQAAYQVFFQEYIIYKSSVENGYLLKKKIYLQKDLAGLIQQQSQLNAQKVLQQKDFQLGQDEYDMHRTLAVEKVETPAELRQQESKLLTKESPLIQTESAIITAKNNYSSKQKDILELDNQLLEERSKFMQALNSLISQAEDWKSKFVLTASQTGKLSYAGVLQENQVLIANQEVFYINPGNSQFFGEMKIAQNSMGKVFAGQQVLIKLKSYPFEEYGMLTGKIRYIADMPYKDSVFIARVDLKLKAKSDMKKTIYLKQGMLANAEIVTLDATILQRISRSMTKMIDNK
jgi:HlyD family secretion protein